MPFIPHTQADITAMLEAIGVANIDTLFDEVPDDLLQADLSTLPEGLNEMEISRLMQARMPTHKPGKNFMGAGSYEHYIPAAVWQIVSRGEFYTAYTPYQAEASQGSLQLIYEYQSMMAKLLAMEVSNASMYDGATALSESVLMALRIKKSKANKILVPKNINPAYQAVLDTIVVQQGVELLPIEFASDSGQINLAHLEPESLDQVAAVIISQPNFFGTLEEVDEITNWAHQYDLLVIAVVNPIAMALLTPPGEWGSAGADIVCGEGQPLGVPLSYGGPYFGFMCCKKQYIRQMPGRIVGKTKDINDKEGYVLTLQAREQHIRRAKATSNICTNQGLLVVAATIYMSLMGAAGLREVAVKSHQNAKYLAERLQKIPGVKLVFQAPFWHEFVISLPLPVDEVKARMLTRGIESGVKLNDSFPTIQNSLLVCVTEIKTFDDLDSYARNLQAVIVELLT